MVLQTRFFREVVSGALAFAAALLLPLGPLAADTGAPSPERFVAAGDVPQLEAAPQFIRLITRNGMGALTDGSRQRLDRIAAMQAMFHHSFALEEIARRVLGRHWLAADADERAAFVDALAGFVAQQVVDNMSDGRFEIFSARVTESPDDVTLFEVHTVLREQTFSTPVVWTLVASDDDFKVLDLTIGGQSFLLSQKDNFERILRRNNGSIQALIEAIRPTFVN